jgi:DNA-binding HxlR family transcriptional regulator
MMLKVLAKKHTKNILELLDDKNMYFGELQKTLKVNPNVLTKVLNEMIKEGLIKKWEEESTQKFGKSYYGITDKGKKALTVLNIIDKLDNLEKGNNIVIHYTIVKGDNNKVVSGNNMSNSTIHM